MSEPLVVKRQSLADQVADAVLAIILNDRMKAGDTLPSTGELAARFAVSRTVVREALADLAGRGIIERNQGRESVVGTPGPQQLQELLDFRIKTDHVSPDALIEFRRSIEVLSARLAAERHTDATLGLLNEAYQRLVEAEAPEAFREADIGFHRAVAMASENPLIILVLDALAGLMRDLLRRNYLGRKARGRTRDVVVKEHKLILDAITRRSVNGAGQAMTKHLTSSQADLDAHR